MTIKMKHVYRSKIPESASPFSMPSKLLIVHGKAKSYSFTVSCVLGGMFYYLYNVHSRFLHFDMLRIKYNSQTLPCKTKTTVWLSRAL